jgi:hypothetical protein
MIKSGPRFRCRFRLPVACKQASVRKGLTTLAHYVGSLRCNAATMLGRCQVRPSAPLLKTNLMVFVLSITFGLLSSGEVFRVSRICPAVRRHWSIGSKGCCCLSDRRDGRGGGRDVPGFPRTVQPRSGFGGGSRSGGCTGDTACCLRESAENYLAGISAFDSRGIIWSALAIVQTADAISVAACFTSSGTMRS